jgi:phenylpropionate dioxygenase-like ring-hydroxylating dioxygenase large terminal subunit
VDRVETPGSYFTGDIVNEPIIVVRDKSGELHALSAVCRHRAQVVAEGEGNVGSFRCPYHGWTYALNGQLIGTPEMKGTANFDKQEQCLPSIKVEVWEGFVFVNFDPQSKPLNPLLEGLSQRVANYRLAEMKCPKLLTYNVACNWKIYVEITMEAYHQPFVHPDTLEKDRPMRLWDAEASYGTYEVLSGHNIQQTSRTTGGRTELPRIEGLSAKDLNEVPLILVNPNFVLILSAEGASYFTIFPEGPERCILTVGTCFPKSTVEWPHFEEGASANYAFWDVINPEDIRAVESSQRGMRSRLYHSGRYSIREKIPHRFHNYVMDRILRQ